MVHVFLERNEIEICIKYFVRKKKHVDVFACKAAIKQMFDNDTENKPTAISILLLFENKNNAKISKKIYIFK